MSSLTQLKVSISKSSFESITRFLVRTILVKLFPNQSKQPVRKLAISTTLAVLFCVLILLGWIINALFGQTQVSPQVLSIFLLGIVYIYILCIVVEFQVDVFIKNIRDDMLPAMVREADRQSLQQSMIKIFSLKRQFWSGFIFSLLAHLSFLAVDPSLLAQFGIGFLVVNIIFHSFHGFCIYFYLSYLEWALSDLKNYKFRLFERDPSSTEVISKIATLLQSTVSLMTLMVASATLIFSSTRVLPFASVAAMVFLMWANTISLYFINHHILKTIICRAKWETLARIQAQIRELESRDKIPTPETLKHISQLQEHHDKIKQSPDSPWDFIRFINTLNTLIWPTLGVIASNLGGFFEFIEQVKKLLLP